jgi:hypothetical protein
MRVLISSVLAMLLLCSCSKTSGGGQHATVELRDGTSVTGTVVSTSASAVQIAGDDKVTRTILMNQVRAIEYDELPAAPTEASPASTATTPGAPPAGGRATRTGELRHRDHYHPQEAVITTRTQSPMSNHAVFFNTSGFRNRKSGVAVNFTAWPLRLFEAEETLQPAFGRTSHYLSFAKSYQSLGRRLLAPERTATTCDSSYWNFSQLPRHFSLTSRTLERTIPTNRY